MNLTKEEYLQLLEHHAVERDLFVYGAGFLVVHDDGSIERIHPARITFIDGTAFVEGRPEWGGRVKQLDPDALPTRKPR